jgi:hypothetical protein
LALIEGIKVVNIPFKTIVEYIYILQVCYFPDVRNRKRLERRMYYMWCFLSPWPQLLPSKDNNWQNGFKRKNQQFVVYKKSSLQAETNIGLR